MTLQFGKGKYQDEVQSFMKAMDEYQLPHPLDRPYQKDTLDWILESNKKYLILCAPTGFGKSPLPAAASIDNKVLVNVLHKSLQSANYKEQYNFEVIYGKGNYPCLEKKIKGFGNLTAFDCSNPHCDCPYQKQELRCLKSNRVSLNYAKFLMSKTFTHALQPDMLFLDEAHNLPDIVTEHVGLTLRWDNEFLQCQGEIKPQMEGQLNYQEAMVLFRQCARAIRENKPGQKEDLKRWRKWKRLNQRILITNEIISAGNLKDWYYETDDEKLLVKPLTAKYHFKRLFNVASKIVLMSATINPNITKRLGIDEDEFDFLEVPNNWPVPNRLIYDLNGPRMNYEASKEDRQKQVELIAGILRPDKSGIIHVSSKAQARNLDYALREYQIKRGQIQFLTYLPTEGIGTDNQLEEWYKSRKPGTYCISWCFHEGVDLGQESINIVAKIPYPSIGSNYELAKMKYDQQWYLEKTAYAIQQACGRTRRGIAEHYAPGARQVFIVDNSWHRLKTLLPSDFRRSIRNWNGTN